MTVTREELAAFADGELDGVREVQVRQAIEADPVLSQKLAAHRALKARLGAHFAPIAAEPVPERLSALLAPRQTAEVVDFTAARERSAWRRSTPRWAYFAAPALAASLALALFLPRGGDDTTGYADAQLASVLDETLVAQQDPAADTRVLLSFRDEAGSYCRVFSSASVGGIACRNREGWRLETLGQGSEAGTSEYRQAGASAAELLARAQEMAAGPALDAAEEAVARKAGWR